MQSRLPLSVALITLNEEVNLPRCLDSIGALAAELVVVDSGSKDRTEEIARQAGAVFVSQSWQGFTRQKNIALERCTQPWVLCLDADEAVSPELAVAIRQALTDKPAADAFWLNRRTNYLGGWIWHVWYPDWCLRLVRRDQARWIGLDPHPYLSTQGTTRRLKGDLLHYSYSDLRGHFERINRYAESSAESMAQAGRRCRWYHLAFSPWLALSKRLILRQGFRDGWRGWLIAYAAFFGVVAKYAFLLERQIRARQEAPKPAAKAPAESEASKRG